MTRFLLLILLYLLLPVYYLFDQALHAVVSCTHASWGKCTHNQFHKYRKKQLEFYVALSKMDEPNFSPPPPLKHQNALWGKELLKALGITVKSPGG